MFNPLTNSDKSCIFLISNYNIYKTFIFTESKVIIIFCFTDGFCKFFCFSTYTSGGKVYVNLYKHKGKAGDLGYTSTMIYAQKSNYCRIFA